jgi:hypothetical protein
MQLRLLEAILNQSNSESNEVIQMTHYSLQFREAYHTQFSIPTYLQSSLTLYKYLKWDAAYFLNQWNRNIDTYAAGTIRRYNELFHVQFSSGISLGKIKQMLEEGNSFQLALSFRKCKQMPAYVIVDFVASAREFSVSHLVEMETA